MTGHAELELLEVGHCVNPEHIVLRTPTFRSMRFPALVGLIEHPNMGPILYDTGYSPRFLEATRPFPERFHAWVTPVSIRPEQTAVAQLEARGIRASDVRFVIVSHFHADHVAGMSDFPNATYIYFRRALESFLPYGRVRGTAAGFLRELLPTDLEDRGRVLDPRDGVALPSECWPFRRGIDLFDDGSVWAVDLPGHVEEQLGLFVRRSDGTMDFLVADACWTSRSFRERRMPHPITRLLFDNWNRYARTLDQIAQLSERSPNVRILPAHCDEVRRDLGLGITSSRT